jgi:hypothetical protein
MTPQHPSHHHPTDGPAYCLNSMPRQMHCLKPQHGDMSSALGQSIPNTANTADTTMAMAPANTSPPPTHTLVTCPLRLADTLRTSP